MRDLKEYLRNYYQTVSKPRLRKRYEKPCAICGKLIHTKGATQCPSCSSKGRKCNWKGGRVKIREYIYLYRPHHPRATKRKYVPEHIIVWEESHNKELPKKWIIHHLNGIKADNRPANLVALPSSKHYIVLAEKAKRIQHLEALLNNQSHLL